MASTPDLLAIGLDKSARIGVAIEVEGIQFQIPSNNDGVSDFEFCISNLEAIVD